MLLPDQLKALWQRVEQQEISTDAFQHEQERLLGTYRHIWQQALCADEQCALAESLVAELGRYVKADAAEIRRRCAQALTALKGEWQTSVVPGDRQSVEQYYDASHTLLYELMWWHTLSEDATPLAYVTALQFAQQHGCQRYLDFGAGVGSGGILFARHGFGVTLADISSPLLQFSQWRLEQRALRAAYVDLKVTGLSHQAFDIITAMDVFEHLVDPVATLEQLAEALRPGGFLFVRLAAEMDEERPQHIVQDFEPTFARLHTLGFEQIWQDDWLWGHQVFRKAPL
ncbi:MAG: class I SAM-dependent methyltransferase [Candidatus Tectimicrobiota bacterium]